MKLKIFLLTLILVVSSTGFSQNVGFMGKRLIVNADGVFSTAFSNPNMNGNNGFFSYNWMISPNLEVITHNKGTLGAVFNYFQTSFFAPYYCGDWGNICYSDKATGINVLGAGIFYKQYLGRNSAAPYGTFIKFQFDWLGYDIMREYDIMLEQLYSLCFKIEMGKDYLFFNRLRVSWGFSVGVPFYGNEHIEETPFGSRSSGLFSFESASAKERIFYHYMFGFRIGVGFLAF